MLFKTCQKTSLQSPKRHLSDELTNSPVEDTPGSLDQSAILLFSALVDSPTPRVWIHLGIIYEQK